MYILCNLKHCLQQLKRTQLKDTSILFDSGIENAMQKFLELSRQTEAFFLRKRMLISFQKPETLVNDVCKVFLFPAINTLKQCYYVNNPRCVQVMLFKQQDL